MSPLSREAGLRYRRQILNNGGSKDEHKAVQNLLVRVSTPEAYLRDIGCQLTPLPL